MAFPAKALLSLVAAGALVVPAGALAAPEAEAPSEPGAAAGGDEPGDDAAPAEKKPRDDPKAKKPKKPKPGSRDEERPVSVPEPGANERLLEDIAATSGEVTLADIVDEILGDIVAEIATRPAKKLSPMAIRNVNLGANITPSYGRQLMSAIVANVHAGTDVRVIECLECQSTRSRIVGEQLVITKGLADAGEAREVAEKIGAKTFADVTFGFDPETGVVELDFSLVRAEDGVVLWSDNFRSDDTTPMLMRSSFAPQRRKDRLRDLEMLLEGRPFYGYVATAGYMLLPYDDPIDGDIGGATAGFRVYERFGVDRKVMFGLDMTGFINTSRLAGGLISAGSWWIPIRPDLMNPELRVGGKAGAFIAGSEGNAAVFQAGAEVLLRYRFGLYAYMLFMTYSEFNNRELGGLGMALGMSFNW